VGPKTEARIIAALERGVMSPPQPLTIKRVRALVERIADALGGVAAGDPRRWKDSSGHLAVAVVERAGIREEFAALPEIVALVSPDVGITVDGTPVTLVIAPSESFGTALVRATGSPEWVEALGPLPSAPDEESVFRLLGLPFVPPELREGTPSREPPPPLLELEQIRGDLHCHTTWSDGKARVLEMGAAARDLG
jgi:DNA polymerase (family X)